MKHKTILSMLFALSYCQADVRLPAIIGDRMLVQRDAPVRIFGTAAAGEAVTVSFRDQNVRTTADAIGRWEVWLAPMKPASTDEMTVRGNNTIKLSDVLVGDVWIGSG